MTYELPSFAVLIDADSIIRDRAMAAVSRVHRGLSAIVPELCGETNLIAKRTIHLRKHLSGS